MGILDISKNNLNLVRKREIYSIVTKIAERTENLLWGIDGEAATTDYGPTKLGQRSSVALIIWQTDLPLFIHS